MSTLFVIIGVLLLTVPVCLLMTFIYHIITQLFLLPVRLYFGVCKHVQ